MHQSLPDMSVPTPTYTRTRKAIQPNLLFCGTGISVSIPRSLPGSLRILEMKPIGQTHPQNARGSNAERARKKIPRATPIMKKFGSIPLDIERRGVSTAANGQILCAPAFPQKCRTVHVVSAKKNICDRKRIGWYLFISSTSCLHSLILSGIFGLCFR